MSKALSCHPGRSGTDPRRLLRLKGYDYSQAGAYFITICTHNRIPQFGEIVELEMRLNPDGLVVNAAWHELPGHYPNAALDAFVVMPNHIHGIIVLADETSKRYVLPEIVRGFKTFSARRINERRQIRGVRLWQRGYYEHVVRDENALCAFGNTMPTIPLAGLMILTIPLCTRVCRGRFESGRA